MSVTKYIAVSFPSELTERAFQSGGQPLGNPSFPTYEPREFPGDRNLFGPGQPQLRGHAGHGLSGGEVTEGRHALHHTCPHVNSMFNAGHRRHFTVSCL